MKIYSLAHGFFGLLLFGQTALALELYVATSGDDGNAGTKTAPYASITAARDALRASGKLGKEPCTVVIGEGVYRLHEPVTFTPADGGSEQAPVVYRAADGARVTFTGAQEVTSKWVLWKDGIYRTQVGKMDAVDQLFVDTKRMAHSNMKAVGRTIVRGPRIRPIT